MKGIVRNIVLLALTAVFLLTGIWLFAKRGAMESACKESVHQVQMEMGMPDTSHLDALVTEQREVIEKTEKIRSETASVQESMDALVRDIAGLEAEYEQLANEDETVYYQTIFQALSEGVQMVERYLEGAE